MTAESDERLFEAFVAEVAPRYSVAPGAEGFLLRRVGHPETAPVRLVATAAAIAAYIRRIEVGALELLGVEPAWRSGVALAAVHMEEEAAMLLDAGERPSEVVELVTSGFRRAAIRRAG